MENLSFYWESHPKKEITWFLRATTTDNGVNIGPLAKVWKKGPYYYGKISENEAKLYGNLEAAQKDLLEETSNSLN